jgi:hypothetical protein
MNGLNPSPSPVSKTGWAKLNPSALVAMFFAVSLIFHDHLSHRQESLIALTTGGLAIRFTARIPACAAQRRE